MPSPLPELHLHLDGSLRPSTLRGLAAAARTTVPEDLLFFQGMGLGAALSRFGFTLSLLQFPAAIARVAGEICDDARAEGVSTLEIRFAPQLHRGASSAAIVDAALEGIAGRAGLILCGLFGEPPEILDGLVELAAQRRGVVGVDLAGGPASSHVFRLEDYQAPFAKARRLGLGRTVHAAEGRSPEEIKTAINLLFAERLGHATTLLDDPAALALVLENNVLIEACPTSNLHTGVIAKPEDHPLPKWLSAGVRATVCSDNTLLSATTTREEHERALRIPGMSSALLARAIEYGHAGAFHRE